jgi:hypothetical protein
MGLADIPVAMNVMGFTRQIMPAKIILQRIAKDFVAMSPGSRCGQVFFELLRS